MRNDPALALSAPQAESPAPDANRRWRTFAASTFLALAASLAALFAATHVAYRGWFLSPAPDWSREPIAPSLIPVSSPRAAREKHLWWLSPYAGDARGVGVRGLESADLFDEIFPGYSAHRAEPELWDAYFTKRMSFDVLWVPALQAGRSQTRLLSYSSAGALELFRRHGADVVVVGSSEMYRDIVPRVLADELASGGRPSKRILLLSKDSDIMLMTEDLEELAGRMAETGQRTEVFVWAFGLLHAYPNPFRPTEGPSQRGALFGLPGLRSLFPALQWADLSKLQTERLLEWRARHADGTGTDRAILSGWPNDPVFHVDKALADDETALARLAEAAPVNPPLFTEPCDVSEAVGRAGRALAVVRRFARKVVLYVPPTPPGRNLVAPRCTPELVARIVGSLSGDDVAVTTDGWTAYGLDYRDFLYATSRKDMYELSANHTNFGGAVKVTRRVAALVARQLGTRP